MLIRVLNISVNFWETETTTKQSCFLFGEKKVYYTTRSWVDLDIIGPASCNWFSSLLLLGTA